MFDLSGKTVLVAGGAGYLGQSICAALTDYGAGVMVADLEEDRAGELSARLSRDGRSVQAIGLDVPDEASIEAAVARTVAEFGHLDVLVNATCDAVGKRVEELTADEFDRTDRVDLTGAFLLARAVANVMSNGGSMIFFASMYGVVSPDPRVYYPPMTPIRSSTAWRRPASYKWRNIWRSTGRRAASE